MSQAEQFVDRIVREVLRRLAAIDSQPAPEGSTDKSNQPSTTTPENNITKKTLRLAAPLVTLETLAGRLADVERVITPRGAVVTPAVKDLLREQGVKWEVAPLTEIPNNNTADNTANTNLQTQQTNSSSNPRNSINQRDCELIVATHSASAWQVQACVQAAGKKMHGKITANSLTTAIDQLAAALTSPRRVGLLLCESIYPALCLANRIGSLRAAPAGNAAEAQQAISAVGANLLVIDSQSQNVHQLRNIVRAFVDGGPRSIPADWADHLEGRQPCA